MKIDIQIKKIRKQTADTTTNKNQKFLLMIE